MDIRRIYQRHYRDNGQTTVYVDWADGSRTECPLSDALTNTHFASLVARAWHEGKRVEVESW